MQTMLHPYDFDTGNLKQCQLYDALRVRLSATNGKCMRAWPMKGEADPPAGIVELDLECLFANQWNTTSGFRVFDWYERAVTTVNKRRSGHYLEITEEMRTVRRETYVCGYCGHLAAQKDAAVFCTVCLGSQYLKPAELHLTRMLPVVLYLPRRKPLTDLELVELLPEYQRCQAPTRAKRLAAHRIAIVAECDKAIRNRDGMLWLIDHDVDPTLAIYSDHDDQFVLGWREPLSEELASEIETRMIGFPFQYEIKRQR